MIIKASTSVRVYKQNKSRQTIFELSGVSKIHISIKNFRNALDEKLLIKKKFTIHFSSRPTIITQHSKLQIFGL